MATITTDTYLDGGVARTAGEAWTCNGGRLLVRTDTRWHANAPASLTGSLGSVTISATLGGSYFIDGTSVRWLAITGGSGTCAIGTTISQNIVSGYFLGYWASLSSAPSTTIGATGFIKLREVTGGKFAAGALSGITASAVGEDVTGWIEVVHDQVANITVARLGNFVVRGDWFYLDNTTGIAGQIIQTPTNGGGAATEAPGIWIETGVGTDEFDFFPSLKTTTEFTTSSLGTDARSKFVHNMLSGQLRIGSDGTNNIGFVPPAGCRTRIPNVIGRQTSSTNRALNLTPHTTIASRPDFTTTSAGFIDIEYFYTDWYLLFAQPYYVKLHHVGTFDKVDISECATAIDMSDGFTGMSLDGDINSLLLTSCFSGGSVEDWGGPRGNAAGASDHDISVNYCLGLTFTRVRSGILAYARSSGYPFYINQSSDITLNECRCTNGPLNINTSTNITVNNLDYVDRYVGTTNTTTPYSSVQITNSCNNITVDGLTFGLNGAVSNVHPYTGCVSAAASNNIKVRNIGTMSTPLNGGSVNSVGTIFVDGGNNLNVKVQRCYLSPTRTGIATSVNSSKNVLMEHVYGDYADAITNSYINGTIKGCTGTQSVTPQASVYGTHWTDSFTSATVGRIVAIMNEPTVETEDYNSLNSAAGFTSAGNIVLSSIGDEYITETPYTILGHETLSSVAPVITGTNVNYSSGSRWGNHDIFYQIDTGSGYGETWLDLTNNISQNISAAGTRIKLRIVCAVAATTNLISFIRLNTTTTTSAIEDNMYPLDTYSLTLTDLKDGSEVRAYLGTDPASAELLGGTESSENYFSFTHNNAGQTGYIQIFALGYQPINLAINYINQDQSIPIQQVIDRVYSNL